jgi:carboxyl-terminal processing protease
MRTFLTVVSWIVLISLWATPGRAAELSTDELLSIISKQYFRPDLPDLERTLREGSAKGLFDRLNELQRKLLVGDEQPRRGACAQDPERAVNRLFTPDEYRLLKEEMTGQFGGIGLRINSRNERAPFTVLEAIAGMPSFKAGITRGDRILSVDGKSVDGLALRELVLKLRGPDGAAVKLGLDRAGKPVDVTLVREKIRVPTVELTLRGAVARLKLSAFNERTAEELRQALEKVAAEKTRGLVVDLRGNPGGLFEVSIDVARMFLGPGQLIVKTARRGQPQQEYRAEKPPLFAGPVVLLVGRETGSSAEILTMALQDNHRALVVGSRTMGKGTAETVISLPSGHALKLTTMVFYGPSGRSPTAGGIEPDVTMVVESCQDRPEGDGPRTDRRGTGEKTEPKGPPSSAGSPPADTGLEAAFRILAFGQK